MSLEESVNNLKRLTKEIAEEIYYEEHGHIFKLIRLLFDNVESFVAILDSNCKVLYINPSAIKSLKEDLNLDVRIGGKCEEVINIINPDYCKNCLARVCINQKKVMNEIFESKKTGRKYWRTCIPLTYNGVAGVIEIWERHNA